MPSFINTLMLGEIKKVVEKANSLILIDASKLKSADALALRTALRKLGGKLKVAKASVLYRVLPEGTNKVIPARGPIGVITTGEDVATVAKLVNDLVKEEKITLKGAILEGRAINAKQAVGLVDLPTRAQASAMVVRTLQAPLAQLVRMVSAKPQELLRIIKVKSEEKPA